MRECTGGEREGANTTVTINHKTIETEHAKHFVAEDP